MTASLKEIIMPKKIAYILILIFIFAVLYRTTSKFIVGQHQKSVIVEMIEWQQEFNKIDSQKKARHAIDMYEYTTFYYTSGEGYFHSDKMASKLENQRKNTLDTIVKSLEAYTGLQHGHEISKWKNWAATLK